MSVRLYVKTECFNNLSYSFYLVFVSKKELEHKPLIKCSSK